MDIERRYLGEGKKDWEKPLGTEKERGTFVQNVPGVEKRKRLGSGLGYLDIERREIKGDVRAERALRFKNLLRVIWGQTKLEYWNSGMMEF